MISKEAISTEGNAISFGFIKFSIDVCIFRRKSFIEEREREREVLQIKLRNH